VAAALVAASGGGAGATDLHSLFDARCRRTTGVLVHVDAQTVSLVDLGGAFVVKRRDEVAGIAVHKTLENPLAQIAVAGGLSEHLRDVWVGDDARPTFTGWTTAFFDDLFLYFDLDGQTHVLDPEEIRRIRRAEIAQPAVRPRVHAPVQLAFPSEVVPCGGATGTAGQVTADSVLPSRVIADRIKVGDYLGKLEQRYLAQAGFEERTWVYAEPFVFDPQNRLGLLYDPEWVFAFPIYFRWSNGRPYRFQSLSSVGNATHEWLPILAPTISARSDIKSHFFNATFVGNLLGLPAGENAFAVEEALNEFEPVSEPEVDHSYNYLLLMGADFWRLSASAGAAYLASRIQVPDAIPRRVLATSLSPTVRLRYQGRSLQLRALYYRTRSSGGIGEVLPDDMIDVDDEELVGGYHWRRDTVRLGATWRPFETLELLIDQIAARGAYRDDFDQGAVAITMWELATGGQVAISFGRYVTVRGEARLYLRRFDVTRPEADERSTLEPRFGGALEFVF
jgi:hypothetical protein